MKILEQTPKNLTLIGDDNLPLMKLHLVLSTIAAMGLLSFILLRWPLNSTLKCQRDAQSRVNCELVNLFWLRSQPTKLAIENVKEVRYKTRSVDDGIYLINNDNVSIALPFNLDINKVQAKEIKEFVQGRAVKQILQIESQYVGFSSFRLILLTFLVGSAILNILIVQNTASITAIAWVFDKSTGLVTLSTQKPWIGAAKKIEYSLQDIDICTEELSDARGKKIYMLMLALKANVMNKLPSNKFSDFLGFSPVSGNRYLLCYFKTLEQANTFRDRICDFLQSEAPNS